MAEIKIEKKKPVWPWILLGLIILGIILYFLFANNDDDMDDMDDMNTEQVQDTTYRDDQMRAADTTTTGWNEGGTDNVSRYITHVGDRSRMGVDHEYTNTALIHLINAVESKAQEHNIDIQADMQAIRQDAEEITQDPMATDHADKIKNAGTKIANVLERIQKEKFPNLESDVEDVRSAAQEIETNVLTLDQKEKVNSFFNEAADALRNMS